MPDHGELICLVLFTWFLILFFHAQSCEEENVPSFSYKAWSIQVYVNKTLRWKDINNDCREAWVMSK